MKNNLIHHCFVVAALALAATVHAQSGGSYSIDWCSVDGGGISQSSGGSYTLSGTAGQPDANPPLTGGRHELMGGFWAGLTVVYTVDAPELVLQFIAGGSEAVLSWDVNATGWQVEASTDLLMWEPVPGNVVDGPTQHTVTVPAQQRAFFRLVKVQAP